MSSASIGEETLLEVAEQMRESNLVQDRTYRLRKYKQCFVGSDAVDWLILQGHATDRAAGVALGQGLLASGIFHHVMFEHLFKDGHLFYRFSEIESRGRLSRRTSQLGRTSHDDASSDESPLHRQSPQTSPVGRFMKRSITPPNLISKTKSVDGKASEAKTADGSTVRPTLSVCGSASTVGESLVPFLAEKKSASRTVFGTQLLGMQCRLSDLSIGLEEVQATADRLEANVSTSEFILQKLAELETHSVALETRLQAQDTQVAKFVASFELVTMYLWLLAVVCAAEFTVLLLGVRGIGAIVTIAVFVGPLVWFQPWRSEPQPGQSKPAVPATPSLLHCGIIHPELSSMQRVKGGKGDRADIFARDSTASVAGTAFVADTPETPAAQPRVPDLLDFQDWTDAPVLVVPNTLAAPDLTLLSEASQRVLDTDRSSSSSASHAVVPPSIPRLACNSNSPIYFETELFKGAAFIYFKGLSTTPKGLFDGVKRLTWIAIQGKFKQPVSINTVVTGQEFTRPFIGLPAPWLVDKVFLSLASKINPSMLVGPLSKPSFLMPLISTAQLVNIAKEGEARHAMECVDDVRLLLPHCVNECGEPMTFKQRQRALSSKKDRHGISYDTKHVYTFHNYQDVIDMSTMSLVFAGQRISMARYLNGQPLQVMAKDEASGKYLYNFNMWHDSLIQA